MTSRLAKKELLKALRGNRSQAWLNNKLGYGFNQVYRWEAGVTQITWPDFVRLCRACKVDIDGALVKVFRYSGQAEDSPSLIRFLIQPTNIEFLRERVGLSRFVVSHWLAGRSTPSLEQILRIVERVYSATVEFLGALVDIDLLPSLRAETEMRFQRRALFMRHPYIEAVLACLQMQEYKKLKQHRAGFIAKKIGISLETENYVLNELVHVKSIALVNGIYTQQEDFYEAWDLRSDQAAVAPVKSFWAQRAQEKISSLHTPGTHEHFGYYIFSTDAQGAKEISEAYFDFFAKVIDIVERKPKEPDQVRALNVHFFKP